VGGCETPKMGGARSHRSMYAILVAVVVLLVSSLVYTWRAGKSSGIDDAPIKQVPRFKRIDLALPSSKTPSMFSSRNTPVAFVDAVAALWAPGSQSHHKQKNDERSIFLEFEGIEEIEGYNDRVSWATSAPQPKNVTAAVGTQDAVYVNGDSGLFGTIFEVWKNHWDLRTSPDDWWSVLITRIAKRIDDKAAHKDVAKLFVPNQEVKKELTVSVVARDGIYSQVYEELFAGFSLAIQKNIAVPGYCEAATADFSTSSAVNRIGSQIALMQSFSKYFDYTMLVAGCGIHALEMRGDALDWERLSTKLSVLRELLAPVESVLNLSKLFDFSAEVFANLARTYRGDSAMNDWWADVLIQGAETRYGPSGIGTYEVVNYNGWLVEFMLGSKESSIDAEKLRDGKLAARLTCVVSAVMKIVYSDVPDWPLNPSDTSIVVAGIMGYKMHGSEDGRGTTLEAAHGFGILLPPESPLRRPA